MNTEELIQVIVDKVRAGFLPLEVSDSVLDKPYTVSLSSYEFGTEVFTYDNLADAIAGMIRLQIRGATAESTDCVKRKYSLTSQDGEDNEDV